ncbi:B3 domain-containing protein [Thalictrum thalictroides]|uniref:B3 domain-containing protein n=1 Tax=Thalictrum thalictroides TaxID=46969 RepID=A0A7J6WQ10_THATH|nr:B3 domain-containing protein [Thalictrum thalictroides]
MVRIRKNKLHYNNNIIVDNASEEICKQPLFEETPKEELPVVKPELKISDTIVDMVEVRRSSRERKPIFFDSEEIDTELQRPLKRSKPSSWQRYSARPLNEVKFASDEERAYAIQCAQNFQHNLLSGHPCFIKSMVRTQVYSCFWLGIPTEFCLNHLPSDDVTIVLEDEDGVEYNSVYLADRKGLSGGWRAFALAHKLDDGDALVFELTEPRRLEIDTELQRPLKRSKPSSWQRYSARPLNEVKFASDEERAYAIQCAQNFQHNLLSGHPCFIKSMVRTQVYSCFWLGIPTEFCLNHLPSDDVTIVLEDEDGVEYNSVYLADRKGLSGGWRAFALAHKLDDGDALVFELTEPRRLEIYVFKAFELHTRKVVKNSVEKTNINSGKMTSKMGDKKATKNSIKKAAKLNQDENSVVENDCPFTSPKAHTGGDGLKTAASCSNEGISVMEEALHSYEDSEVSVSSMVPHGLYKRERDQTLFRITPAGGWKSADFCCNEQTFESREDGKSCEGGDSSVSPLVQLSDDLWFGKKQIGTELV